MEAELVSELPQQGGWRYEPKWDGFRGVLENDGGELALWSRNGRPLLRYFPELRTLGPMLPPHSALDGEIVIELGGRLDFDAMQMRLHPAESRIRKLSAETPATYIAFDILLWRGEAVHERPLAGRRPEAQRHGKGFPASPSCPGAPGAAPEAVAAAPRGGASGDGTGVGPDTRGRLALVAGPRSAVARGAARGRLRGALRQDGGGALSPRDAVPAVPPGQGSEGLHLGPGQGGASAGGSRVERSPRGRRLGPYWYGAGTSGECTVRGRAAFPWQDLRWVRVGRSAQCGFACPLSCATLSSW